MRVVRLSCLTDGAEIIVYRIRHAWRLSGGACSSVFWVEPGSPLSNTTILTVEQPWQDAALWLWLSTSCAVRQLEPSRLEDRVLGSDFAYDDFRMWTPRSLRSVASCAEPKRAGTSITLVAPGSWRSEPVRIEVTVETTYGIPVRVDWTRVDETQPFRTLAATGVSARDGGASPQEISVTRPAEPYESRMSLVAQSGNPALPAELFSPDGMVRASEVLSQVPYGGRTTA